MENAKDVFSVQHSRNVDCMNWGPAHKDQLKQSNMKGGVSGLAVGGKNATESEKTSRKNQMGRRAAAATLRKQSFVFCATTCPN
jgi:hypothetical protein